ncbi:MAG: hypothetical protein E6G85_07585 [Alphaproteobacteria bacterium]|nr:MAG: hypothetical protein E6G85_07585 [Alphaproteobacteria bacterium]
MPAIERIGTRDDDRDRLLLSPLCNEQANQAETNHWQANGGPNDGNAQQKTTEQQNCTGNPHLWHQNRKNNLAL